jgi:hypothetical protein
VAAPSPSTPAGPSCKSITKGRLAKTYDYIIVGAGAAGIPLADRISAAGNTVLLIEKGPPSSGRYNGTMKPDWLKGTNLTRFDVPGLCNQIWVDSEGIACTDTDQMAGCVLGGGTAVNAGLWWKVSLAVILESCVCVTDKTYSRTPRTGTIISRPVGRALILLGLLAGSSLGFLEPSRRQWMDICTNRKASMFSLQDSTSLVGHM